MGGVCCQGFGGEAVGGGEGVGVGGRRVDVADVRQRGVHGVAAILGSSEGGNLTALAGSPARWGEEEEHQVMK